jgi:CubicO group peptidase (beta-lactamase class C family)
VDQNRAATGHVIRSLDEGPMVSPVAALPRAYGPGGNVSSTAREVLTLASVVLNGGIAPNGRRILSAAIMRQMMESRMPIPDPYMFGPWWGLGLIVCEWHGETVYAHDGSTIGQHARLRILPDAHLAIALLANGGPRESFYRKVFNAILADVGAVTIPDVPQPDLTLRLDVSRYVGAYARPGARYEVEADGGRLSLTFVRNPLQAHVLGKPERSTYALLPISATHFLMPSDDPLEDTQTVAIYDIQNGLAQYLHTNCRVNPRVRD